MMMAKKKGSGGQSKNNELRGGENTLPKKADGTIDIKKVVKQGVQEQKKKWVDKKVVKDRTTPKQVAANLKKAGTIKPKPAKGVSKIKALVQNGSNQIPVTPKKSNAQPKGISKLKAATPKKPVIPKKAPVRKAPVKGR